MEIQQAFNIAVALAASFGGWWMHAIWEAIIDLRGTHSTLIDRVQKIEVLVAGDYVPRDEMQRLLDAVFRKLDRIEQKLDAKADR